MVGIWSFRSVVLNLGFVNPQGFTGRFPGVLGWQLSFHVLLFLISYSRGECMSIENPRRFCQLTSDSGWLFYDSRILNGKKVENAWIRINFLKNVCLNYFSQYLVLLNFRGDNAKVFQRVSMNPIWPLVKPHANCCVNILKARWLRPALSESYRLLRVILSKERVAVHVLIAPHQRHNWRVAGVRTSPAPLAS